MKFPILAAIMLLVVAVAVVMFFASDANALSDQQCNDHICVGMHDTIENRIQVERKSGQYSTVVGITALRDTTSEWLSDFPACSEQFCRVKKQKSRRSKYLNYQCKNGEDQVGVYVVYNKSGRIKSHPASSGDTTYSSWTNSIKLPVSC